MDKKVEKAAKEAYKNLLKSLDEIGWKYERNDDIYAVKYSVKSDDFPMTFIMYVEPESHLYMIASELPIKVDEGKRADMAIAICRANYRLADGWFEFDIGTGKIHFKIATSYSDSLISAAVIKYLLNISGSTVDKYNDKLIMIAKGMYKLDDFLKE